MREPLIACLGDTDVDTMIAIDGAPGADRKVNGRELGEAPGGMAANVAAGLARLGGKARLLSVVGDDAAGTAALARLAAGGVDVDRVRRLPGAGTFRCIVLVAPGGEKLLVRLPSPAYLPEAADLREEDLAGAGHLHLTLGSPPLARAALALARRLGLSTSLDLERADLPEDRGAVAGILSGLDLLFVNRASREAVAAEIAAAGAALGVVTTLGADGARLAVGGDELAVAGLAVPARDTTGAGDAFAAAFLHMRVGRGADPGASLRFANAAAALATLEVGAQAGLPRRAEVERFLATGALPRRAG